MVIDGTCYSVVVYFYLFFAWGDDCFEAEQFVSPGGFPCLVFACGELPYEKAEEVKSWFFLSIFIENVGLTSF